METTNIVDFARRDGMTDALTDLLRTRARQLIATAVEAEPTSYLVQFAELRMRQVTRLWYAMGIILNVLFRRALAL
jgi:hypothetical protein